MGTFLQDTHHVNPEGIVTTDAMYRDWCLWWAEENHPGHPGSRNAFVRALKVYRPLRDEGVRFDKKRVGGGAPVSCVIGLSRIGSGISIDLDRIKDA